MRGKRRRHFNQATRVIALSFAGLILAGTALLLLPAASADGRSCGLMTALFTATSASCVTGLVLRDTLTGWTLFGQAVILLMIQLGGLGFMTLLFCLGLMVQRRPSLSQRLMMVSAFNLNDMGGVARVVRHALRLTLLLEGAGAAVLALCFAPRYGWGALWKGLFISVSAFCNAGFDILGPDGAGSLSSCRAQPVVLLTVMLLIVCGGLGFFVWEELRSKRSYRALSLYSRMVLWLTGGLIALGAVFFFCAECHNDATLGALPLWQRALGALFQSVTLRTAGFTIFDQGALTDVSMVASILLMLVGGSSGSTAGGMKTVTLAVLLLSLRSGVQGREEVALRGRTIPQRKVLSALTLVLVVSGLTLFASLFLAAANAAPYLPCAYEAASAIATVGLSTGLTAQLGGASRVLLVAMMYLGRVGVLSFSVSFLSPGAGAGKLAYPEADVMIG